MDWPSLERWERFAVVGARRGGPESRGGARRPGGGRRGGAPVDAGRGRLRGVLRGRAGRLSPREGARGTGRPSRGPAKRTQLPSGPRREGVPRGDQGVAARGRLRSATARCSRSRPRASARPTSGGWPRRGRLLARPIRRWLAAKAFASWIALQGEGLRTTVAFLRVALGVLRAEAARGSPRPARALDADAAAGGRPPGRPASPPPRRSRGPRAAAESRRGRGGPRRRVVASPLASP